jgi:hypothetical protein
LAISFVSTLLGLASAFWQHIGGAEASSLTRLLTYDVVEAHIGATSAAFGWIAASLTGITTLFLLVSILSMKILSELVD